MSEKGLKSPVLMNNACVGKDGCQTTRLKDEKTDNKGTLRQEIKMGQRSKHKQWQNTSD